MSENVIKMIGEAENPPNLQKIIIATLLSRSFQPLLVYETGLLQGIAQPAARIPLHVRPGDVSWHGKLSFGPYIPGNLARFGEFEIIISEHLIRQTAEKLEDACLLPLVLSEGLVVTEDVYALAWC